ncbi:chitooligosaccharidolytic beta-N-acetylglucosaminidase [Neodiprion fabricii]|uniref:chitooligosaccharidolytic beta-N-acetylglucosaminidase n=1 Tax=Neodiprion fabricii TaxID=2872261 RepID=UPI001ED98197|nr:chitooligosaccharidolytic beta-N-acetylglucosaminidase [Neodiprion fabricii]XP_046411693.1 chitooligosaccharidolytic beta-N-acetylglucosaminidase [Neodiprion fabricii]
MRCLFYWMLVTVSLIEVNARLQKTFYRSFKCQDRKCSRTLRPLAEPPRIGISLEVLEEHSTLAACRLVCDPFAALWPIPTGLTTLGNKYTEIHPSQFKFVTSAIPEGVKSFVDEVTGIFTHNLQSFCDSEYLAKNGTSIAVTLSVNSSDLTLDWLTLESYSLDLRFDDSGSKGEARLTAQTVYGLRHGLETLLQLTAPVIMQGGIRGLVIITSANIKDAPEFVHRGLTLDTSRNFVTVPDILRTIDGLSSCKMNVLHWHVTDSQSFPIEIKRVPAMTQYGAYSQAKIYSTEDVKLILKYGKARGVRVIPELDMPAHSGAGWEWGEEAGLGRLGVCIGSQPWQEFCIQPPCGQLNPTNANLYNVLREIYKDIIDLWGPSEIFHMGGDEVFIPCWNSTKEITDAMLSRGLGQEVDDFLQLWSEFQASLLNVVNEERGKAGGRNVSTILWSSYLTSPEVIEKYLDKNRYVIQTWVESSSPIPRQLLNLGYQIIVSTKNTWYLDHGFWGNTKYHTWRDVYKNRIPKTDKVLGGEVASWGEYVDSGSLDPRLWPRTAAVAERLWSNPIRMSTAKVEPRLHGHRDRLTIRGINSDAMAPEWCAQHDAECQ